MFSWNFSYTILGKRFVSRESDRTAWQLQRWVLARLRACWCLGLDWRLALSLADLQRTGLSVQLYMSHCSPFVSTPSVNRALKSMCVISFIILLWAQPLQQKHRQLLSLVLRDCALGKVWPVSWTLTWLTVPQPKLCKDLEMFETQEGTQFRKLADIKRDSTFPGFFHSARESKQNSPFIHRIWDTSTSISQR